MVLADSMSAARGSTVAGLIYSMSVIFTDTATKLTASNVAVPFDLIPAGQTGRPLRSTQVEVEDIRVIDIKHLECKQPQKLGKQKSEKFALLHNIFLAKDVPNFSYENDEY